jgi:hypothetical protein
MSLSLAHFALLGASPSFGWANKNVISSTTAVALFEISVKSIKIKNSFDYVIGDKMFNAQAMLNHCPFL